MLDLKVWRAGMTEGEIARAIGCTRQNANLITLRALRKLRAVAEKYHLREFLEET
jgi:transcriptional regulator